MNGVLYVTDPRVRSFFQLTIVLLCLLVVVSCDQTDRPNVMIITFDTTRADHIGTYGRTNAGTPNLDALAEDGVVYEKALTSIPITLPSHSSIMTGKVPFVHGVRDNGLFELPQEQLTLAEILKNQGYATAAAIGSFPLTSQFGINQGFDHYNEHIGLEQRDVYGEKSLPKKALFFDERTAAQVNDGIMPWLQDNHHQPFFAWLHYFDPHHPHEPPSPYDQLYNTDLYQGEIAFSDESLGQVIAQLKRLNVYDNTLIIFTSDHGEGNNEHNESTHSFLIYNATLHVPLIIKYPQQKHAKTRIADWVALVDIFPSVLAWLKIEEPEGIQGVVLPTDDHTHTEQEIYSETLSPRFYRGWGEQRGLVKNHIKYIHGPKKELYDLNNDPKELNNLIDQQPQLAESMRESLQEYIDEYKLDEGLSNAINRSENTINILRGLGYVQSSGEAVTGIEEKLDDSGEAPQKYADSISTQSTAKHLLFNKQYIQSIQYIDALLLADPGNQYFIELKIQALMMIGDFDQAMTLLLSLPDASYGEMSQAKRLSMQARLYLAKKQFKQAQQKFIESEQLEKTIAGQYQLSLLAKRERNLQQQQRHLLNMLDMDGNLIQAWDELAISYVESDDFLSAEEAFVSGIKLNPNNPQSRYNYGVFLYSVADWSAAIKQFNQVIDLNKDYLDAHYALIEILLKSDRMVDAQVALKRLKQLAPSSTQVQRATALFHHLNEEVK